MINYSIVQKSQLECAHRLDAQFYQHEYFIDFSKGKWNPIGDFLETCQYGISQSMNEDNIGYPIFRMDDIKNGFLITEGMKYVDITREKFIKNKLKVNDLLFNRVNSEEFVGRTGIFKLEGEYTFASYLIRLKLRTQSGIYPDYLNVFLNSSYGRKQIRRYRRRAVNQANVNAEELKKIKIAVLPRATQEKIKKLINQSWNKLITSKNFYSQAENLLLQELGLNNFKPKDELSFIVNLSETRSAHRADAEYFQPKYDELISKFKSHNTKPLLDLVNNVPARFSPKNYPGKRFKYIELSNIDTSVGTIDGHSDVYGNSAPSRARRVLKAGDVIVSSVEGSLEKVALIGKIQDNSLASTGFFQFRSKRILPEVLLVIAKSIILQLQLKKHSAGTILTAVPKDSLNQIVLPVLPNSAQQEIAAMVRKSHEAREKSNELFEKAVKEVDSYIEKQQS